jgi:hypothetical protein
MSQKRSPLKAPPLRNPGQSLDEEIERIMEQDVAVYVLGSFFIVVLAALVWVWYLTNEVPNPIVTTLAAVVVVAYSAYKMVKVRKRVRALSWAAMGRR